MRKLLLAPATAVLMVAFVEMAQAESISVSSPYLELFNVSANTLGITSGEFIRYGAVGVTPYGNTKGTATTTNTITGDSVSRTIFPQSSPNSPYFYQGEIAYDPGLYGPWNLTFKNSAASNTPVTETLSIPAGTQQMPFVQNLTLTNGTNPTISWSAPPGNASVDAYSVLLNAPTQIPIGNSTILGVGVGLSRSYTFSQSSYNGVSIVSGDLYYATVRADQTRNGMTNTNESNIAAESNVYTAKFSPTPTGAPRVYLPVAISNGGYQFNMTVNAGQTYYIDPAVATGYIYQIGAGDPNFASVDVFTDVGSGVYQLWALKGSQFVEIDNNLAAGQTFDFLTNGFLDGLAEFEILGIDPNAGLDPTDSTAFITGLTFDRTGSFTGTQTPITTEVTPIPAALPMFAGGLGLLGLSGWRRKRKAHKG